MKKLWQAIKIPDPHAGYLGTDTEDDIREDAEAQAAWDEGATAFYSGELDSDRVPASEED